MLPNFKPMLAATEGEASLAEMAISHVLPHRLHDEPLFSLNVAAESTSIPALNIYNGQYDFYVTNHLMMTVVSAVVLVTVFTYVAFRIRVGRTPGLDKYRTKGAFSQLFETVLTFIREEVVRPNLHGLTDKYVPYVWTVFFFILFANLLGMIPIGYIVSSLTGVKAHTHFGGTATGNLSLNVMLAACSFIAVILIGIRETGAKRFFAHFNPIGWDDPKMLLIGLPLYVLEWLGLIIKCAVLAMRLFGTMMAGHLVIASFVLLIFSAAKVSVMLGYGVELAVLFGGVALTLLEIFICCLQAFIFTFLTVLFIAMAVAHHDDAAEGHSGSSDPFDARKQMNLDKLTTPDELSPARAELSPAVKTA